MFTFPFMGSVTVPASLGGSMDFPSVGAVLAWTLIAALVGTVLGILRERTSPQTELPKSVTSGGAHLDVDHIHREAA